MHAPADAQLSAARLGPCQHSGSVPARHCWVSRLDRVRQLTGKTRGEARGLERLARGPCLPKGAERRPLAPADPGALAPSLPLAPPGPRRGRPGARTPCGRAGGQARRGRVPAAPRWAARWRRLRAELSAASVRLPPLPSAARPGSGGRRGAEARDAAEPRLRRSVRAWGRGAQPVHPAAARRPQPRSGASQPAYL